MSVPVLNLYADTLYSLKEYHRITDIRNIFYYNGVICHDCCREDGEGCIFCTAYLDCTV